MLAAARPRLFEYRAGHSSFDQSRANGIDAYTGAGKLIGRGLDQTNDAGLACTVGHAAGAGTEPGDRRGTNDGTSMPLDHFQGCVLNRQKSADQVDLEDFRPALRGFLEQRYCAAADAGVRIAHIEAPILVDCRGHRAGNVSFRGRILD